MEKQDADKLIQTLEDGLKVYEDVKEAKESGDKITWAEGGALVIKHGGKAIRFISSLDELKNELIDLDAEETKDLMAIAMDHFGGTDEVKAALEKIALGAGNLNQGIQELIANKVS